MVRPHYEVLVIQLDWETLPNLLCWLSGLGLERCRLWVDRGDGKFLGYL